MSVNSDTPSKIEAAAETNKPAEGIAVSPITAPSMQEKQFLSEPAAVVLRRPPSAPIVPAERVRPLVVSEPKGRGRPRKALAPQTASIAKTQQKSAPELLKLNGSAELAANPVVDQKTPAVEAKARPPKLQSKTSAPANKLTKAHSTASSDLSHAYKTASDLAVTQARDLFQVVKSATDQFSEGLEKSSRAAQDGAAGTQARLATLMQAQVDAAFGYVRDLAQVRSLSDMIDLNSTVLRRQFDENAKQIREINAFAGKTATLVVQPVRDAVTGLTSGR